MTALYGSRDTSLKYRQQIPWTPANKAFMFESCVILNGSKTTELADAVDYEFESCVVLNGSKTVNSGNLSIVLFESCVILNGSKTSLPTSSSRFPFGGQEEISVLAENFEPIEIANSLILLTDILAVDCTTRKLTNRIYMKKLTS